LTAFWSAGAGSSWPKAAEIIECTYTGNWANSGRFTTMLRTVYLPEIINGSHSNGNGELSMTEVALGVSVFLADRASYDKAMAGRRSSSTGRGSRPSSTA
jgi:hypothetical protein